MDAGTPAVKDIVGMNPQYKSYDPETKILTVTVSRTPTVDHNYSIADLLTQKESNNVQIQYLQNLNDEIDTFISMFDEHME